MNSPPLPTHAGPAPGTVRAVDLSVIDDDELTRLALSGDSDAPLPADAVPLWDRDDPEALLPSWYMPAPAVGAPILRGWRRLVAWIIVGTFLAIVSAGLCSTYGEVVIATVGH